MTSQNYLSELFSLDGRVAVVTGGSSGIGRGITDALARAGARVVVVARREAELTRTVAELTAEGCRAAWVSADLGTTQGVRTAGDKAVAAFGEPDILVNCAGINLRPPMGELDEDVWDTTMTVNLKAPYLLGRRFGPGMAERGYGRIIHITSQQAHRAFVQSGAYGVSKGALESLARSQAEAWSPRGVTCNTLVPGFVMTPSTSGCPPTRSGWRRWPPARWWAATGWPRTSPAPRCSWRAPPRRTSPGSRSSSTAGSPCTERCGLLGAGAGLSASGAATCGCRPLGGDGIHTCERTGPKAATAGLDERAAGRSDPRSGTDRWRPAGSAGTRLGTRRT